MDQVGAAARQRQGAILSAIERAGVVRAAALATKLGVTVRTLQRDLDALAEQGLVMRVHGGASVAAPRRHAASEVRLGLILPNREWYYEDVRLGVAAAAVNENVVLYSGYSDYSDDAVSSFVRSSGDAEVDGVIVTPNYHSSAFEGLLALRKPTVIIERPIDLLNLGSTPRGLLDPAELFDHVHSDHALGLYLALDHLYRLGHRAVHCLIQPTPTSEALHRALHATTEYHAPRSWGRTTSTMLANPTVLDAEDPALVRLIAECRLGQHTALLVHSHPYAETAYDSLIAAGIRVPQDVSLVSYDVPSPDHSGLPLTHISPRRRDIGRVACGLLLRRLRDDSFAEEPPLRIAVPPQLVPGMTTAPPPTR